MESSLGNKWHVSTLAGEGSVSANNTQPFWVISTWINYYHTKLGIQYITTSCLGRTYTVPTLSKAASWRACLLSQPGQSQVVRNIPIEEGCWVLREVSALYIGGGVPREAPKSGSGFSEPRWSQVSKSSLGIFRELSPPPQRQKVVPRTWTVASKQIIVRNIPMISPSNDKRCICLQHSSRYVHGPGEAGERARGSSVFLVNFTSGVLSIYHISWVWSSSNTHAVLFYFLLTLI
jgi:hypothetical protein